MGESRAHLSGQRAVVRLVLGSTKHTGGLSNQLGRVREIGGGDDLWACACSGRIVRWRARIEPVAELETLIPQPQHVPMQVAVYVYRSVRKAV